MGGNLKDVRKQAAKNQKKRKKGEKLAKKDHDGDGKIETGSQEYLGSRDRAIKQRSLQGEVTDATNHRS